MENSPIKYLDNDVLNNMLPEYVAKMRKKKWFEDLINILVKCYKGSYKYDMDFKWIFDIAYSVPKSDILKKNLMDFSDTLYNCQGFLLSNFNLKYNLNRRIYDYEPSMDTDFIPFHNLFTELTGKFDPEQLIDFRFHDRFYPNLCEYYQYLKSCDPHIKELKKEINLRFEFKHNKANVILKVDE